MRTFTVLSGIVFVLFINSLTMPQSVRESFEYPEGPIDGRGTASDGWGGPWEFFIQGNLPTGVDAPNDSMDLVGSDFLYSGLDYAVPNTGRNMTSHLPGDGNEIRYSRSLAQTWADDGSTYWVSVLMQMHDVQATSIWSGVGLYYNTNEGPLIGKGWGDYVYSFGSGAPADSEKSSITWDYGPVWLVARLDMSGDSGPEKFYLWINPDPAVEPDISAANVNHYGTTNNGFNRIVMHYGQYAGITSNLGMTMDEIRLGKTWADVSSPIASSVKQENIVPAEFALSQNYPNPFNPVTNIRIMIPEETFVTLKVYDVSGREAAVLINQHMAPGTYNVDFPGNSLSSGTYFYRLTAGKFSQAKKMILIK